METINFTENGKINLLNLIIFVSIAIFFSYVASYSFLIADNDDARTYGVVLYILYALLFTLFFVKYVLGFSYLAVQKVYGKSKLVNFRKRFVLAYLPFVVAAFVSIYLFVKSKSLYDMALNGEAYFYESELINSRFIPLTIVIAFSMVLITKTYLLHKFEKIPLSTSALLSVIASFVSAILFFAIIIFLMMMAYFFTVFLGPVY